MKNETKKVYSTPRVTVHGDAAKLTQTTTSGPNFDRQLGADAVNGPNILKFS